jgi:hypothetical protein
MKKNERAIRLTIAAFMVVFGLMSLSQAGYFVIRYLTINKPLDSHAISLFVGSSWRCYWMFFGAYLIQLPFKQILANRGLFMLVVVSLMVSLTTIFMYL